MAAHKAASLVGPIQTRMAGPMTNVVPTMVSKNVEPKMLKGPWFVCCDWSAPVTGIS